MEKVQWQENTIEVFENDIQMYLAMFCEENGIEYMKKESQSVWNSALYYIYKHVFKNGSLKNKDNIYIDNNIMSSTYNMYNYDMCMDVLNIYVYDMCMKYDKEVSVIGYSTLTGISQSIIYEWANGEGRKLSSKGMDIYKKLNEFREESLSNKLVTGNKNPVGVIAVLNRQYGWASPYTSDSNRKKQALTAAELPKLQDANCAKMIDNSTSEQEIIDA